MKTFKSFKEMLSEINSSEGKPKSEVSKAKEKMTREKGAFHDKQDQEMDNARERDFERRQKEREQRRQQQKRERIVSKTKTNEDVVLEVLEIGTDEIVQAYKKAVPGQSGSGEV